jgi:transcriptional regulator with XRE-family HTH domain
MSRDLTAETSGITSNYLGEIERGEKWPSFVIICAIAAALNVSPSVFFEFDEQETNPRILLDRLHRIVENRTVPQQQQALKILKSLFES